VLQERLLAHRTLHFTREQMFWECRTLMACELYPAGIRTIPECGGHHTQIGGDDLYIHRAPDSLEETNRGLSKEAMAWNRIEDLYTRCDLTKASEKLIALPGIAIEFHRTRLSPDDQYLAGLWKSQLPNALLWEGGGQSWEGAATTCSRPRSYRAPSWSWASIDGPISMRATEQRRGRWYHIFTEVLVADSAGNIVIG
jgi:hypothetical protein